MTGPYGLLIKIGLGIAVLAASHLVAYNEGSKSKQKDWDAAVGRQATKTISQIIAESELATDTVVKFIEVQGQTKTQFRTIEKKVVEYVAIDRPVQLCAVDTDFISLWDDATRVYNEGLPRVPATVFGAGEPDGLPRGAPRSTPVAQPDPNDR